MVLSFLIFTFLKKARSENKVQVKVNGSRRVENGLLVHGSFLARTTSRAITTNFEGEIIRQKNLCTHMDIRPGCFCNVALPFVCELLIEDEPRLIRTCTLIY